MSTFTFSKGHTTLVCLLWDVWNDNISDANFKQRLSSHLMADRVTFLGERGGVGILGVRSGWCRVGKGLLCAPSKCLCQADYLSGNASYFSKTVYVLLSNPHFFQFEVQHIEVARQQLSSCLIQSTDKTDSSCTQYLFALGLLLLFQA